MNERDGSPFLRRVLFLAGTYKYPRELAARLGYNTAKNGYRTVGKWGGDV